MRVTEIEIYSDAGNGAVMRHPDRKFPGVLIQGDTLHNLCHQAGQACEKISPNSPDYDELNEMRLTLRSWLNHYKATLIEHKIPFPFYE